MGNEYIHIEIEIAQSSKKPGAPCGDLAKCDRTEAATTLVLADGIGSGIRARIAAEMCVSRVLELLRLGFSLRRAFEGVVYTMEQARDPQRPFAAFTVVRVRPDGLATVLGYEAPPPVLVSQGQAMTLPAHTLQLGGSLASETSCVMEPGEGLLVMSDGITQAGLGNGLPMGWQTEGVLRYLNRCLADGVRLKALPDRVHREARRLWKVGGDDCTIALALSRRGQIVNLLTGPPCNRADDVRTVRRFIQAEGLKVVCGGTTAEIVARALGERVLVEQNPTSLIAPPRYGIPGIDVVTEGAVTLNQVYNVLDEDVSRLDEDTGVSELCALLQDADRVNIHLGGAQNRASDDISFRQRGILMRDQIVPLLADKLRARGKLVVIDRV